MKTLVFYAFMLPLALTGCSNRLLEVSWDRTWDPSAQTAVANTGDTYKPAPWPKSDYPGPLTYNGASYKPAPRPKSDYPGPLTYNGASYKPAPRPKSDYPGPLTYNGASYKPAPRPKSDYPGPLTYNGASYKPAPRPKSDYPGPLTYNGASYKPAPRPKSDYPGPLTYNGASYKPAPRPKSDYPGPLTYNGASHKPAPWPKSDYSPNPPYAGSALEAKQQQRWAQLALTNPYGAKCGKAVEKYGIPLFIEYGLKTPYSVLGKLFKKAIQADPEIQRNSTPAEIEEMGKAFYYCFRASAEPSRFH